jgi:hypothetical protein
MDDAQILAEIERRIKRWFELPGWSEENDGLRAVQRTIDDLRRNGAAREWDA